MGESSEHLGVLRDAAARVEQMRDWFSSITIFDHPDLLTVSDRKLLCEHSDFLVQFVGSNDERTLHRISGDFFEFVAVARREGREVSIVNNAHFKGGAPSVALRGDSDYRMLFRHQPRETAPSPDVQ